MVEILEPFFRHHQDGRVSFEVHARGAPDGIEAPESNVRFVAKTEADEIEHVCKAADADDSGHKPSEDA